MNESKFEIIQDIINKHGCFYRNCYNCILCEDKITLNINVRLRCKLLNHKNLNYFGLENTEITLERVKGSKNEKLNYILSKVK